ncbi:MAG: endonuclease III [Bdellovibrionales bacterium]|nr:endonuclease III [Bdellovibrionales bacterium]
MAQKKVVSARRERMREVIRLLKLEYPDAHCALHHRNAFELLVATILSAQCTDERVNLVTPKLFHRFPDAKSMSQASLSELEKLIQSTGFYKNKAISLKTTAGLLMERHEGQVPSDLEALTALRGVGRKTANVIRGTIFGLPAIVVDTHVGRLSRRLGFTRHHDPVKVEFEMMEITESADWTISNHLLIDHGRAVCQARKPDCGSCVLKELCPKVGVPKT